MRIGFDAYCLKLAMLVSERATCPRLHCGCVIVKNRHIISTGFNGSLPGEVHCQDVGCQIEDNHCVRCLHAEQNALLQAAKLGHSVDGATSYVTTLPCRACSKSLIASGIKRIVVFSDYHRGTDSIKLFEEYNIQFDKLEMPARIINYNLESYSSGKEFKEEEPE